MASGAIKIIPHLWFDREAEQAVGFYTSVFKNSSVTGNSRIENTPSGGVDIITFHLEGQEFIAINAGPTFKFNESVSFFVYCGSEPEIDRLYEQLSDNGSILMPLGKYAWSGKYAWVKDRFGVSWQLDVDDINSLQKILPSLLFVNEKAGMVKEAVRYYKSIFPGSGVIMEAPYDNSAGMPDGALLFAQFNLSGFLFNSMSSSLRHEYDFNESISFMVYCSTQEEIDYFWEKLSAGGVEQQCGWVKDRFGISWQVVPELMDKVISASDPATLERVTSAMLKMSKLDKKALEQAFSVAHDRN